MKVVLISRGLGDYVIGLINSLSKKVDLYFIVPESDEWILGFLDEEVTVIKSGAPRVSKFSNIFYMIKLVYQLRKIKPDIIHFQSGVIWELILFTVIKSKFVTTVHDVVKHPTNSKMKFIPQFLLDYPVKRSDAIVVHGEQLKALAQRLFNHRNIYSIEHGIIDKYGKSVADIDNKTYNILLFGSIDKWKGVEYLVQAAPLIHNKLPESKIKIAGSATDKEYYYSLSNHVANIEMILERQGDEAVTKLFDWADVLVLPYVEASQSGVLQLGMAFALPPIVSNVGGLPEVIQDRRNGLVVPSMNVDQLADSIVELLSDNELRKNIIENICEDRESVFSWDAISNKTYTMYKGLLR